MNRRQLLAVLFPVEPRTFTLRRFLQILLRTVHILCAGVLIGAYVFSQPPETLLVWVQATVASGLLLLLIDLHASLIYLFEGRGLAVLVKICLTALIPVMPQYALALLLATLFTGSFSSHAPRRYRHRVLAFGERLRAAGQERSRN